MLKRLLFAVLMLLAFAAQAAVYSLPWGPKPQFVDANGAPMVSGTLLTFIGGSTTPQVTYTDSGGGTSNPTTITLNSRGETPNEVWLASGVTYKFVLKDSGGTTIWTVDGVTGVNDTTSSVDQWKSGPTPTFVSATSFTLAGDQTGTFMVGRRLKTTNSGGTVYSTISASVFGASTTVTVVNDSGSLDSGLSAVSYGLISASNSSAPVIGSPGSAGTVLMVRTATTNTKLAYVAALNKQVYGLTYANNVADATNDLDIAAGGAMDATGAYWMTLASALTKQSDAVWAVGSAAGGLDLIGSAGNNDFYIWLIARSDTGVVDALFSLSSTAPTMPANYDFKRLIGWFKRVGGTIVAFRTYEREGGGIEFRWDAPTRDINLANTLTTARRTDAVKVPLNFSVEALLQVYLFDSAAAYVWIGSPDTTDVAVAGVVNDHTVRLVSLTVGSFPHGVRTSATGTIAARSDTATVDNYDVATLGFIWGRR